MPVRPTMRPVDLGFAQNKFQQAQAAMASGNYADAANLAEESRADAELAQAKARLGAARAQIQNKVQENSRLRAQGERDAAADPPPASRSDAARSRALPIPSPAAGHAGARSSALVRPRSGWRFQTVPDGSPSQPPNPIHQGGQP